MIMAYIVQVRCNFSLACEQFTHTFKQFTCTHRATHGICFITHQEIKQDYQISSGVVSHMVTHISLGHHVVDHHNVYRLVLGFLMKPKSLSQPSKNALARCYKKRTFLLASLQDLARSCRILWDFAGILQEFCARLSISTL